MTTKKNALYNSSILSRKIELSILEIGNNIEELLHSKLVQLLEGKCNLEGYFKKQSIEIISYSSGEIIRGNIILFDVVFNAKICLPVEGMILNGEVNSITKAGIKAHIKNLEDDPIVIFIMKDHFAQDDYFNSIQVNNLIKVRVIGQRHEINDSKIYVIGELMPLKKLKVNS